jgi:hypothetical protein
MANTTNFNWETPDDTDLVKDGAAAMRTLGNSIDTSFVDLKGGTTGQILSKASNTDLDYTWVTTDDANAIQNAIVDAKGDLIAASAADTPARLAVGADNTFLRANSSAATGLEYAGAYTTFTPAWINVTVGNGTNTGRYLRIGNVVHVQQKLTWGSTTSIAGPVYCGFPIAANSANNNLYYGNLALVDNGVETYFGAIQQVDTTNFLLEIYFESGSKIVNIDMANNQPFTWATGDFINLSYTYEVG